MLQEETEFIKSWRRRLIGAAGRFFGTNTRRAGLALFDQSIVGGMNFLTLVLLGRLGGPEQLGIFSLALSVIYIAVAAQESLVTGPYTVYSPRMNGRKLGRYRCSVLLQYAAITGTAATLLLAAGLICSRFETTAPWSSLVLMLACTVPCWLLREVARRFAFAELNMKAVLTIGIVSALIQLFALAVLSAGGWLNSVTALAAVSIASGSTGLVWLACIWHKLLFRWPSIGAAWRRNWKFGRWLLASQVTLIVRFYSIPWMVAVALGTSAVGVLAACEGILRLLNPIFMAAANVLTPRASQAFAEGGYRETHRVLRKATFVLVILLGGICGFVVLAGRHLLSWSFGQEYAAHYPVLAVVAISTFFARLMIIPERGLMVLQRTDQSLKAELAGFASMLAAVFLLMPSLGIFGAALGYLAGTSAVVAVMTTSYWWLMRNALSRGVGAGVSLNQSSSAVAGAVK